MSEDMQGTGGTRVRPAMTPHEMLAASARLGSSYPPRSRPATSPRFVHTQQYDESGFPIPMDRGASFAERVRQLLRG